MAFAFSGYLPDSPVRNLTEYSCDSAFSMPFYFIRTPFILVGKSLTLFCVASGIEKPPFLFVCEPYCSSSYSLWIPLHAHPEARNHLLARWLTSTIGMNAADNGKTA